MIAIETRLRMLSGIQPGRDLFTVRAVAGVEAARAEFQAFVWNVGTERPDVKGEVRGADPRRARVPMRDVGADWSVVAMKPGNAGRAKGPACPASKVGQPFRGGAHV